MEKSKRTYYQLSQEELIKLCIYRHKKIVDLTNKLNIAIELLVSDEKYIKKLEASYDNRIGRKL